MRQEIERGDNGLKVTTNVAEIEPLEEAVFVLGQPRSGTSASCQLLNASDTTEWLLNTQSDQRNVYGYYEHKEFLTLCGQMISTEPGEWHANDLGNMMENLRQMHGLPGVKMLHVPAWFYWQSMTDTSYTYCIFRRPDVCRKSKWRQRLFAWSLDWHLQCNMMIAVFEEAENAVITSFERLLKRPDQVAGKVEEEFGFEVDPSVIDADQKSWDETDVLAGDLEEIVFDRLKRIEQRFYGEEVVGSEANL